MKAIIDIFAGDELHAYPEDTAPGSVGAYLEAFDEIAADSNNELWVAELEGRVVGTFQLTFMRQLHYRGARVAQIEAVHVQAGLRGRGIGEQMMRTAIDRARARGCLRVQLTSHKRRREAHRFYERLGFVATHEGMKLDLGRHEQVDPTSGQ